MHFFRFLKTWYRRTCLFLPNSWWAPLRLFQEGPETQRSIWWVIIIIFLPLKGSPWKGHCPARADRRWCCHHDLITLVMILITILTCSIDWRPLWYLLCCRPTVGAPDRRCHLIVLLLDTLLNDERRKVYNIHIYWESECDSSHLYTHTELYIQVYALRGKSPLSSFWRAPM